jgi:Skp family chaperone for outer membrane proteins
MVQEKKKTLDDAYGRSMGKLRAEAAKIIAEVAKERGYSAVFTQDAVIMAAEDLDMTDEVIARLNKNVKKIPVEWTGKKK